MVRDVCRRSLGRDSEIDDAVQAVFLVLAQRGGTIRNGQSLTSWLFGVAYRVCQRTRRDGARRRERETRAAKSIEFDVVKATVLDELCVALDAELVRLPEKYRAPLVHCYLQGQTRDRAAGELRLSLRTLDRRLEQGRSMLRRRLERSGLTFSAAMLAGALSQRSAETALPRLLIESTFCNAVNANHLSPGSAALEKFISNSTSAVRRKVIGLLLVVAATAVGATTVFRQTADQRAEAQAAPAELSPEKPASDEKREEPKHVDLIGEALPPGAIARLGVVNWQIQGELADCMAVTADGKNLVTASRKDGIAWWNMDDGLIQAHIPAPSVRQEWFPAQSIALSPDGRRAAISDRNSILHVLDLTSGKEIISRQSDTPILELAISTDGSQIGLRTQFGALSVWNVGNQKSATGAETQSTPTFWEIQPKRDRNIDWVYGPFPTGRLAFSPDGKLFAWVGLEEGMPVHIHDTAARKELAVLGKYRGNQRFITFSPDGAKLASLADGSQGEVWDLATHKVIVTLPKGEFLDSPVAAFSPDGKAIALKIGPEVLISIIEITTGKQRWRMLDNWSMTPRQDVLVFTPDSRTLLVNAYDPVIRQYDAATGTRLLRKGEATGRFNAFAFSHDRKHVYSLGSDSQLRTWDAATGKEVRTTTVAGQYGRFSVDGRSIIVAGQFGSRTYDTESGRERWQSPEKSLLCISDDGKLAALTDGKDLVLRDVSTGKDLQRLGGAATFWSWAVISPDSRRVYVNVDESVNRHVFYPGPIQVWDVESGRVLQSFSLQPNGGYFQMSADGKTIALHHLGDASENGCIELFETLTGKKRLICSQPHVYSPTAPLRFTPDRKLIATADYFSHDLDFYDIDNGEIHHRIPSYSNGVNCWAISRDGKYLVTAGTSTNALIWDLAALPPAGKKKFQSASDLPGLWLDLDSSDATKAYKAMRTMVNMGDLCLPYLDRQLAPAQAIDAKRISAWISQLDNDEFAIREKATKQLEEFGVGARFLLDRAQSEKLSEEANRRIDLLLSKINQSPDFIRSIRALEVIEHIGTPVARRILKRLAQGEKQATMTAEASAALERLSR
jgi:RNA polymerase sigma factor (sigma-70 family)